MSKEPTVSGGYGPGLDEDRIADLREPGEPDPPPPTLDADERVEATEDKTPPLDDERVEPA